MNILDTVRNIIGAYWSVGAVPSAGTKQATVTATMTSAEIADTSDYLRLQVWADFGAGPKWMATGAEWHGGPGQVAPSLVWQFDPNHPPKLVYGVLENGTHGAGSPATAGLSIAFV